MTIAFHLTGENRKTMVKAVSEILEATPHNCQTIKNMI